MKYFISVCLLLAASVYFVHASSGAPLESGFAMAPRSSASTDEKNRAYLEARNRVINAAVKYENTPYAYGGMTSRGLDCSGFVCLSFKDALGVNLPRSASGLHTWAETIPFDKAQPGDLLFFKTDNSGRITHVGIYLGNRSFIHSASAGPSTGVIYSNLEERYWARTFAGAGRAFPEVPAGYHFQNNARVAESSGSATNVSLSGSGRQNVIGQPAVSATSGSGRLLVGAAFAPTWNGFLKDGSFVRGFTSQIRIGADTYSFPTRMLFGLELRPEYDGALGVFRLPVTFSWGIDDRIRIFAGPGFSFGEATLSTEDGERSYNAGSNWFAAAGLTLAPFIFDSAAGEFAPYFEIAWQSYFRENASADINADFSAGFRVSTGLRWTMQVK